MKKNYILIFLITLVMGLSLVVAETPSKTYTKGNVELEVSKISYFDYMIDKFKTVFAFVQPSQNVMPGDEIQFDSREYMDCGLCDYARYRTQVDGYRIKVFNAKGNLVHDEWFTNWELPGGGDAIACGNYANFVYYYNVPQDAVSGNWMIKLEVATSSVFPGLADCIVAQDEGSFTVGEDCDRKDEEVKYCVDINTRYYKPANSCNVIYTNCDDVYGTGWKCKSGECEKVEECGDGICDDFENPYDCYNDCGSCGDGLCTGLEHYDCIGQDSDCVICTEDCFFCGDGVCNSGEKINCGSDCANCGDGECYWYEKKGEDYACKEDCFPDDPDCGSNLWCKINNWIKGTIKTIALLFGIIAGIFGFVYGNKIMQDQKMDKTVRWILNIIVAFTLGFLIYFVTAKLWWLGLILLILIIVLKNAIKGFKLW